MLASLSAESRIATKLHDLGCAANNFVLLAKLSNVNISTGRLSQALNGQKHLDNSLAAQLLTVLNQMSDLQSSSDLPIAWERTDKVFAALVLRSVDMAAKEAADERIIEAS